MSKIKVELVTPDGYHAYLEKARRLIDLELADVTSQLADIRLAEKVRYILLTQGKRLRPILAMLSAQSVGGNVEHVEKLAVAIELLHTATLIHDDILDQDVLRRNALTANAKWGVRDAVLTGDALASLSLHMVASYGEEIVRIMSRTCLLLSDGEYMDVENAASLTSETDYLEMIRKKSASLFKAATECGAIAVQGSRDEIDALGAFGENFGMAYQIKDDISDMVSFGDALPQDVNEFRATLPIIHLCESSPELKDEIIRTVAKIKTQSPKKRMDCFNRLCYNLTNKGSWQYCVNRVDQYVKAAVDSVEPLVASCHKSYLVKMCDFLREI